MAIAIVVEERATGAPRLAVSRYTALRRGVCEVSVAAIPKERILPPKRHVKIVEPAVPHVAHAHAAAPTRARHPRVARHIAELSVAQVAVEMIRRRLRVAKALQL